MHKFVAVQQEKARRDELSREKDKLQGQVAELGGLVKSQERLLELEKVILWTGDSRCQFTNLKWKVLTVDDGKEQVPAVSVDSMLFLQM